MVKLSEHLRRTGVFSAEEVNRVMPPPEVLKKGPVAVVECIQEIPCDPCHASCPFGAIKEFKDINDTIYSYQLGTLKYESQNAYFIDQSYNFENGAIILSQPNEGDITFLEPNIFCSGNQITCNLIKLNNIEKEDSITGFGTYPIKLYFLNKLSQSIKSVKSITVYNSHIMAWEKYFDNLLKDNTEISYTKNSNSNDLTLTFEKIGSSVYPDIEVYQTILNIKITST